MIQANENVFYCFIGFGISFCLIAIISAESKLDDTKSDSNRKAKSEPMFLLSFLQNIVL